jgi:hypothetical protein
MMSRSTPFASRGQASLEFILVLIFMLVIMAAVVVPLGQRAQFALEDVSKTGFVSSALHRAEFTISTMTSIPGGSRQNIDFFLPRGTSFVCNPVDNNVGIIFPLNTDVFDSTGSVPVNCTDFPSPAFPSMSCTKYVVFPPSADLHCQGETDTSYLIDAGQNGFTQTFTIRGYYSASGSPPYIIDFNVV